MRAIVWNSKPETRLMSLMMDRPYVQQMVELLVRRGVERIDFAIDSIDAEVKELLGDGTRWGIQIQFSRALPKMEHACSEMVLFCDAACLPALPDWNEAPAWPILIFHDQGSSSKWTGWALIPADGLEEFHEAVIAGQGWRQAASGASLSFQKMFLDGPSLAAGSAAQVLSSNALAIAGKYPGLNIHAREVEPQIWIGRGAKVSPKARLKAPCFIGEDAWVGEGCEIGPCAVLGSECVVERGTRVAQAVVGNHTYLGAALDVIDSVATRNIIENVRLGTAIHIEDEQVASSLDARWMLPAWVNAALGVSTLVVIVLIWIR